MKRLLRGVPRSLGCGALGALVLAVLLGGTAGAQEYPKTVCDGDNCSFWANSSGGGSGKPTSTFNKRGKFSAVIGPNNQTKAVDQTFDIILANGYGDVYYLTLLRDRENYQAYRGYCTYRGFSLSGCSTTGEVVLLRMKATPSFGEHCSLVSTSWRWGTTLYILNDVFRPLASWVSAGYENWFPFDMSCSVAMYTAFGGWK